MGIDEFTDDSGPDPKPKGKRTLAYLPNYGAPLGEMRDWLTVALGFPTGFYVEDFIRHGRGKTDPCVLIVATPGGGSREYRFDEQRMLSVPANIRSAITSETDGLARMRALGIPEREDVWTGLVTLATITVQQTQGDETRDWLERFVRATSELRGQTLEGEGRFDALQAMRDRPAFTRTAAANVASLHDEERPVQLVDKDTGQRYVRAGDVATYVRHVIAGVGSLGQGTLNGRMAGIGVEVITFEVRRGDEHPRLVLYRLPEEPPESTTTPKEGR